MTARAAEVIDRQLSLTPIIQPIGGLLTILNYRRPHGSWTERKFIKEHLDSVEGMSRDKFGNRYLRIDNGRSQSTTMISCHTDTVHTQPGYQRVKFETREGGVFSLADKDKPLKPKKSKKSGKSSIKELMAKGPVNSKGFGKELIKYSGFLRDRECLGADDGAGMWVSLELIKRRIPGLYVFHRGEECGGLGSDWIAEHNPEFVEGIERCIAIDRKGKRDIITHQMRGRCCSEEFGRALGAGLNMGHENCPYGSFTDSANYMELIPECTNVSAGYMYEHSDREWLSQEYVVRLVERLAAMDLDGLPTRGWWVDRAEDARRERAERAEREERFKNTVKNIRSISEIRTIDLLDKVDDTDDAELEVEFESEFEFDEVDEGRTNDLMSSLTDHKSIHDLTDSDWLEIDRIWNDMKRDKK